MLPIVTFIAIGAVGWFAPTHQYPASSHVCASNAVPVGATIDLYYAKTKRGVGCLVVGTITSTSKHVVDTSQSVRNALGFKNVTSVQVYRALSNVPPCPGVQPEPSSCAAPPAACIAFIPKPALNVCVK